MSESIDKIPEKLLLAFLTKKMCIFIGSGISQNLGMPDWNNLAKKIIELTYDYSLINFEDKETLLRLETDPVLSISYCHELIKKSSISLELLII